MDSSKTKSFTAKPQTSTSTINGNAVLLSLSDGGLYGLNPVAERVWEWLQQPRTASSLVELVTAEFEVSAEVAAIDIQALLDDLSAKNLLTVTEFSGPAD